jgi:hypothetical protein
MSIRFNISYRVSQNSVITRLTDCTSFARRCGLCFGNSCRNFGISNREVSHNLRSPLLNTAVVLCYYCAMNETWKCTHDKNALHYTGTFSLRSYKAPQNYTDCKASISEFSSESCDFFFNLRNPSSRTIVLGFTQSPAEMSTRRYFWGLSGRRVWL